MWKYTLIALERVLAFPLLNKNKILVGGFYLLYSLPNFKNNTDFKTQFCIRQHLFVQSTLQTNQYLQ